MTTFQRPKGILFTQIRQEPYTRKDGKPSLLLVWQATCAREGCDTPFIIKTCANYQTSNAFLNKHCGPHKMTKAERDAARIAARRLVHSKGNTKLSDADVVEIRASHLTAEMLSLIYPVCVRQIKEILSGRRR